jgi:hypothetical protein
VHRWLSLCAMLLIGSVQRGPLPPAAPRVTDDDLAIMTAVLEGPLADRVRAITPGHSPQFLVFDRTARICQRSFETRQVECFHELPGHEALNGRNGAAATIASLPSRLAELKPLSATVPTVANHCASFREHFPAATTFVQFSLPAGLGNGQAEIYVAMYCGTFGAVGSLVRLSRDGNSWNPGPLEIVWVS